VDGREGYVVVYPNREGATTYGQEFGNIIQYKYPGDDYKDLMIAVDSVIRRGYVDSTKLGVTGGSGGGLLTDWRWTHAPLRRRGVAAGRGRLAGLLVYGGLHTVPAVVVPLHAVSRSPGVSRPLARALRGLVTTPLMFILGEEDLRAPPNQGGEALFRALKYLHRTTVQVRFPGESHELSRSGKPVHRVERLQHILNWFDKYLLGKTHQAVRRAMTASRTSDHGSVGAPAQQGADRLFRVRRVEPHLQQASSVVVVLPEEVLQARREQAHGRRAARQLGRAPATRVMVVSALVTLRKLLLPVPRTKTSFSVEHRIVATPVMGSMNVAQVAILDCPPACRARGPRRCRCLERGGKRGFAVGPVLVEHFEHAVGRLTEQNLRRNGVAGAAPEVNEDDVAAPVPIHVGILVVRDADDVEIEMRAAGRAIARRGLLRDGPGGRGHRGRHSGSQVECETHKSSLESVRGRSDREKHQAPSATSRARRGVLEPGCPRLPVTMDPPSLRAE